MLRCAFTIASVNEVGSVFAPQIDEEDLPDTTEWMQTLPYCMEEGRLPVSHEMVVACAAAVAAGRAAGEEPPTPSAGSLPGSPLLTSPPPTSPPTSPLRLLPPAYTSPLPPLVGRRIGEAAHPGPISFSRCYDPVE
mmetsp:Transcript_40941/g.94812  ORF Transcript_40941/g.94812 Transcript_40941/m.94812 type:complete len:136 (-) Transcript_40941:23-430(-)